MKGTIKDIVVRYRKGAIANGNLSDPIEANKGADQVNACYKMLRDTHEGREALVTLMEDPEPSVRCWSAAECLQWKPDVARQVLEKLRDSQGPFSFTAEMTLEEYDNGRLRFDY